MNSYVLHQNKIKKNINAKNFLQNSKQEFPCQSLENFSGEYYNMENNILDFQFEPVCAKQARPNYSVGSNQDEAEIQYDRCSTHRSSHQRCSMKKCVFSNFVKFTGKHLCQNLLFNNWKRDSGTGVFPWIFQNF